jgi:hypothetical protein
MLSALDHGTIPPSESHEWVDKAIDAKRSNFIVLEYLEILTMQ